MSSYNEKPIVGHLQEVYNIFAYLNNHTRSKLVLDDMEIIPDENMFHDAEWNEFYQDSYEPIPENAPDPLIPELNIPWFVDSDHAGNVMTRWSHKVILTYLNNTPISWYSKLQITVESSTFRYEFNSLRISVDQVKSLRYKLRMFGIKVEKPSEIFCDNEIVTKNSSIPESTLSKNHNSVCYHRIREEVASNMIRVAWLSGELNYEDLFKKPLTV